MRHFFELDGRKSSEYGLYISGSGTFDSPERDYEVFSVPGRSGDLIYDNNRYSNVTLRYPAFINRRFQGNVALIKQWLLNAAGYRRLEDSYHPEEYRMAVYSGRIEFDVRTLNTSGETTLQFNCYPQRYLKTGEDAIEITESAVLQNPTGYPAEPLIRVYMSGSGTLDIGGIVIEIAEVEGGIDIDCALENAYYGTQNLNKKITLSSFPTLKEATTVSFTGDITKLEIKPRWWRL